MQSESTAGYYSEADDHRAEALFHVEVVKVNTVNCTGKTKRVGRFTGKKADFKKAIITINPETTKTGKDGKKLKTSIEFFDGMF